MKILGIETSSKRGSLSFVESEGDAILCKEEFEASRGHNATLFGPLEKLLEGVGVGVGADAESGLDVIVVGTGPGSYSGVRVGIAAANGLSVALGVPVLGLSSLLAPGCQPEGSDYWVTGDARRQSFFLAEIRGGEMVEEPELFGQDQWKTRIADLLERGEKILTFDERLPGGGEGQDGIVLDAPDAAKLAILAGRLDESTRASLAEKPLEPIYLRAPFITEPKG